MDLEESLNDSHEKWRQLKRDYENLEHWSSNNRRLLADYECAMNELKLVNPFELDIIGEERNILTNHIKLVLKEKRDLEIKTRNLAKEITEMRLEQDVRVDKSILELDRLRNMEKVNNEEMEKNEHRVPLLIGDEDGAFIQRNAKGEFGINTQEYGT